MKKLLFSIGLFVLAASSAYTTEPARFSYGPGGNPLPPNRDIFWSEPPDLEGLLGSSEQILDFGLETELANDFLVDRDLTITLARWWGGYYNYTPGDPLVTSFNLRFYAETDCLPGDLLREVVVPDNAHETFIYDQGGYPIYEYHHAFIFEVIGEQTYWFVAQAGDHPFPPQWGRLQAAEHVNCDAAFRSAYFSYPDWIIACDLPPIHPCDFSQEFEDDTAVPAVDPTTWGKIRARYR
jgi:hypothetical protein